MIYWLSTRFTLASHVQSKEQSFYTGSAWHEENSKSEFVIEISLFIRLNLTEHMEMPYQRCTMVLAVVTSANTLQSKIDHPEKYEITLH